MSAKTVRQQLVTFLTDASIPGVQRWYVNEPWFIDAGRFDLAANAGWGAVGWPHIAEDSEERRTMGAPNPALGIPAMGQKEITYKVGIYLLWQYLIPAQLPPGADEDCWSPILDDLIESVKARLRSDPKAGTAVGLGDVIQQQSQNPGDLHVRRQPPERMGGKLLVWTLIETTVVEVIAA